MCKDQAKAACKASGRMRLPGEVVYYGTRCNGTAEVWRHSDRGLAKLPQRQHIRNHSPDGFEWGYGGSGPAQLALALCCEVLSEYLAERVYQHFKFMWIGRLPNHGWRMSRDALTEGVLAALAKVTHHPAIEPADFPVFEGNGQEDRS